MAFIINELSFILMFRITITTKECLYSKNFTLTIRTTFCSVMIDKARVHSGGTISPYAFIMPAIAIDECTHSPKNENTSPGKELTLIKTTFLPGQ